MTPARQGSFRIFRFRGIDVSLHWLWFLFAYYSVSIRIPRYESPIWGVLEYLTLFLIVLTHEFGHSLACRSVGGTADHIVLWPLGGVAYVDPPPRAGAYLWSIAAGPLVNVVLAPILFVVALGCRSAGWTTAHHDLAEFLVTINIINGVLLCFNLLPIYPLDGGQMLRGVLWYWLGRARSQMVAASIGLVGIAVLALFALQFVHGAQDLIWDGVLAFFLASNCWRGLVQARALRKLELLPRRPEFACPVCHSSPPIGSYWLCRDCRSAYDTFATGAVCPHCGAAHETTTCPDCREARPFADWRKTVHDV